MSATKFTLRLGEPGYPEHLAMTPRPPKILRGIGDPTFMRPGLAVIGSRKATPYGLECARRFASLAAEWGVLVVSGGAIGCDLAAHRATLAAGGPTVVVLGCGADVDYPRSAADMLAAVRGGAGCVVSEFDWGVRPLPGHFPARNRIIAGLSWAVLVVEAALPSGTFSTADHALDAGRDVLAVPGSVFYAGSAGCNRLIRQGAQPITCVDDLYDSLADAGLLGKRQAGSGASNRAARGERVPVPGLSPSSTLLLEALRADPMSPDRAATVAGLDAASVLRELATLEARGLLARYPDGRYGPCSGV